MAPRIVIAGLGYCGAVIARDALAAGFAVSGTARDPARAAAPAGVAMLAFAEAGEAIARATHLVVTAAPDEAGDPVLRTHRTALREAASLRWIGYLSTTGVYGDRLGDWVDEASHPAPGQERSRRRLEAERGWADFADRAAVDLFRTGGIYGPWRTPFAELRAGLARRLHKPGHAFSRIHRDDIALAVIAAASQAMAPGVRVLHLVDDEPAESAAVTAEAARLLGIAPPPLTPYEAAALSPMARSFWAENRRVANAATKQALGIAWRHPTYREGLAASLAEELREGRAEQCEI